MPHIKSLNRSGGWARNLKSTSLAAARLAQAFCSYWDSQMKYLLLCLAAEFTLSSYVYAQRDPPVWESYIASTTITHGANSRLDIVCLFKKEGGRHEHTEHQMYLIGYLKKDEKEVLKHAADKSLLDKTKADAKFFLDVLKERRLVTVIATHVGNRTGYAAQDTIGKYRDGSDANRGKAGLKVNTFPFAFSVKNNVLFDAIAKLKNFDAANAVTGTHVHFKDTFKFLLFVPVNDCKYADKISKEIRGEYDFAKYNSDLERDGDLFYLKTPSLYLKPLPHEFQFTRMKDKQIRIYIN